MIVLHQFHPALGLPNASPFCLKLELYLRMAELPYRNHYTMNPRSAPKGKLPWIDDDGVAVADSGLIVEYLERKHGGLLDRDLSAGQRALSLAVRRMVEEHLYWALIQARWIDEAGWRATREAFFGGLGFPLKALLPRLARRSIHAQILGHGLGRHTPEEIMALGIADIDALAELLGDQPYYLGARATSLDASVLAFIANIARVELDTPLKAAVLRHPNLVAYGAHMERYFPAA